MEQLLSTHGGNYKTDFGLRETIDFNEDDKNEGWNRLFGYIQGKVQDERIDYTIQQMRCKKESSITSFKHSKKEPVKPLLDNKPESLTDVTRIFLTNMKKKEGKKKKIKPVKMIKNYRQKKKVSNR